MLHVGDGEVMSRWSSVMYQGSPFLKLKGGIYKCKGCSKWWQAQTGPTYYSCAVMHGPGDCCHYSEKEIEVPEGHRTEGEQYWYNGDLWGDNEC